MPRKAADPASKRVYGTGGVGKKPRADGRWPAWVSLPPDGSGKRKRRYLYGATRREAEAKMRAELARIEREGADGVTTLTVGEWLDRWLAEVVTPTANPRTARLCRYMARLMAPLIGGRLLTKLTSAHLQAALATLSATHAPSTISTQVGYLSSALSRAVAWGLIGENPVRHVVRPRQPPRQVTVLDEAQAAAFIAAAESERLGPQLVLALCTGLRLGELNGLRWRDVDLARGTLTVAQQAQYSESEKRMAMTAPKGEKTRTLALPATALAALRRRRVEQDQERAAAGAAWANAHGLIFTRASGAPLHYNELSRALARSCDRAGVPRLTPHGLRHSAATLLLAAGVNVRVIVDILGHANASLLMRTYGHVLPSMQAGAAAAMERAIGGQIGGQSAPDMPGNARNDG